MFDFIIECLMGESSIQFGALINIYDVVIRNKNKIVRDIKCK